MQGYIGKTPAWLNSKKAKGRKELFYGDTGIKILTGLPYKIYCIF